MTAAAASQLVGHGPLRNHLDQCAVQPDGQRRDPYGNVDPTFNGSVTLALASNPGSATLGGTVTVNAINGVATFAGL